MARNAFIILFAAAFLATASPSIAVPDIGRMMDPIFNTALEEQEAQARGTASGDSKKATETRTTNSDKKQDARRKNANGMRSGWFDSDDRRD